MVMFRNVCAQASVRGTAWIARHGILLLRLSMGVVFLWFGVLKFFPGSSPAQDLAARTILAMSSGVVPPAVSLPLLAAWETMLGLGFVTGRFLRAVVVLLVLHMLGTFMPLVLFPRHIFIHIPYALTLEGQYIVKNLVLLSAGLVIGTMARRPGRGTGPTRTGLARRVVTRASCATGAQECADAGGCGGCPGPAVR